MHSHHLKRAVRSATLGISLLALLSVACERPHAAPGLGGSTRSSRPATSAPQATPVPIVPTDTAALRSALAPFFQPIDTLVTLGAWLGAHPHAAIDTTTPPGTGENYLCRFASDTVAVAGRRAVRTALFNLPHPPQGEALPSDTTQLANRVCHLRGVWLVTEGADTATNQAILTLLEGMLVPSLGASHSGVALGNGVDTWVEPRAWGATGEGTTLAIVPVEEHPRPNGGEEGDSAKVVVAPQLPNVVLVRVAPHSGFDPFKPDYVAIDNDHAGDAERELERARVDTALALARWPRLSAEARILLPRGNDDDERPVHTAAIDSALVRLTIAMRDSAAKLEPVRRAAAYYVADFAMNLNASAFNNEDSVGRDFHMRRRLDGLGIGYQNDQLGDVHVYPRTWLWNSWTSDSLGPAGHLAFLTLLRNGWGTEVACSDSGQAYERVRKHGEAALRRGEASPLVHFYMGQAEQDVVALSQGAVSSDFVTASEFAPLAPAARVRAIAHLRAALAGLRDTRLRRDAWRTAMALLLGRSSSVRYYCVYD